MGIGVVNTRFGKVEGVELEGEYAGITMFKGIPYAAPPIGRLRWAAPEDPEPWEGIRKCDKYAPVAVQKHTEPDVLGSVLTYEEYYYQGYPEMSEDCLYLNICTPAQKPTDNCAVYMWFHGGGLTNGYAFEPEHNPVELAKRGVIVVQVTHRLNLFGYMALPQLSAEQGGKSGNYGFMDEIKALDWVYNNIAYFGGDPRRITCGGQSGGSRKSCTLAASPYSQGRVRRVINESGLSWRMSFYSLKDIEEQGIKYLEAAGIDPNTSVEELRALPTYEIFKEVPRAVMPGHMIYDGDLIPYRTLAEMFDKNLNGTDYLSGCCCGEAEVFAGNGWNYSAETIDTKEDFYAHYKTLLGDRYDEYEFEKNCEFYKDDIWRTSKRLAALGLAHHARANDRRSVMLSRIFGMYMAERYPGSRCYTYLWDRVPPVNPGDPYRDPTKTFASHSAEMWYVFNSMRPGVPPVRPWEEIDYKLADMACSYWANFIKNGDPNGEGLPYWPAASEDYGWMNLGDEFKGSTLTEGGRLDELIRDFDLEEYMNYDTIK